MNQIVFEKIGDIRREMSGEEKTRTRLIIFDLLEIISIQQEMIEGLAKSRDELNSKLKGLLVTHTKYGGGYQPSKDLDLIGKELPSGDTDVMPPKSKPITCDINIVPPNGDE